MICVPLKCQFNNGSYKIQNIFRSKKRKTEINERKKESEIETEKEAYDCLLKWLFLYFSILYLKKRISCFVFL